ncbi:putative methyltransferase (DUF3321) domain containing protein [Naviculisporaceae sp. PSN 640]
MGTKKAGRAPKSLSAGRPPTIQKQKPKSIARKTTKAIINKLHLLEKRKAQAVAKGDSKEAAAIDAEIRALGGLERYQEASLQGQRHDRGGDSSRVLMEWLKPYLPSPKDVKDGKAYRRSMLEVGALSTENACSKSGQFDIVRIDLNSQGEGILQQDFMKRPLPVDNTERFDIISLSLVLNFVPDPKGRGEMLVRTVQFLRQPEDSNEGFPSLFLVLPAPCVSNSRYLDEDRLEEIMASVGYTKIASKTTQRLVYYLWRRVPDFGRPLKSFSKKEVRSGPTRNNFAITLG